MEEGGIYNKQRAYRRHSRKADHWGSYEEGEDPEEYQHEFDADTGEISGEIHHEVVPGEYTKTGVPKEHFGHGEAALHEAGKKGAEISIGERTEEQLKEAARKAARTRAERYGHQLHVSDPAKDELLGVPTKIVESDEA